MCKSEARGRWRVLHVLAPARVGGLERVVSGLAAGHRGQGHEVHVAALVDPGTTGHPFSAQIQSLGVPVTELPVAARAYWRERAAIARLCRQLRPDIVHTHGYRADVVDAPVARGLGVPTVTTVHGFTGGGGKNRVYEWLQRRAFRRFEAVVAVSRPLAEQIQATGVPGNRLHVIQNGWVPEASVLSREDARRALGIDDSCFRMGWVGRLTREKGGDVLLHALRRLSDLPVRVSILGTGRDAAWLRERARRLGVGCRITWHGMVPKAAQLFDAFDLFVLSSRTEGTPIVLFEAMAARIPIVATRVGGVPDVVDETGAVLVPPDDPAALAAAIRTVFSDRRAARGRALRAHERLMNEFATPRWLAAYVDVYRVVSTRAS